MNAPPPKKSTEKFDNQPKNPIFAVAFALFMQVSD